MKALTLTNLFAAAPSEPWSEADREHSLCQRALQGDCAAWNELIARHNRKVVVVLLSRGIPMFRAKDLAQETWLRLIEQQRQNTRVRLTR